MISFKNILTISKYESKVLWRNWFFRIVALAGVFFVTVFNIGVFSEANTPRWYVLSNGAFMPYAAMVMISIPQVAAVIFLATGLIKKDKKIDTNEVFFIRPMSNLDYVLGKAFALFKLFFLLNLVLLLIPLVVNLTSPFTTFDPLAFVMYPLLMSIPSVVFTTGMSFLLVTLIRNQPIAIVLFVGLVGVELIYYFGQFSNILDFMAFRLSLLSSEIAGTVDLKFALIHRLFYLSIGIAFLFITAFFLDRLSSHKTVRRATGLIGLVLLGLSSVLMLKLWDIRQDTINIRQEMIEANGRWADEPNIDIVTNRINLELAGDQLVCTANMTVKNNTGRELNKVYFTLNPELIIEQINVDDKSWPFSRDLQIVSVDKDLELAPNQEAKVQLIYSGSILESVAHLEVDQERYEASHDYFMFSLQKKYAFLQEDYVLLTNDVLWYPDTQIGYSRASTQKERHSFIQFELEVMVPDGLIAVSQGQVEVKDNTFIFKPAYTLPQISLAIGDYEQKEITVDSVSYAIYHYPDNDYFVEQLGELTDTLSLLITDINHAFEDGQKLKYPFDQLLFVETPIQFTAYDKIYESHQAYLQPETVYWPEEGGRIRQFDFRRQLRDMDRQAREDNMTLTDKQKQANVFNDLVKKVFTKQIGARWVFDGRNEDEPDYSLFPNYYTYNAGVVSKDLPLLNRGIATYLKNERQAQNDFSRNLNGISFTEECNNMMREASITAILTDETEFNKIKKAISLKSKYLFSYLGQLIDERAFKDFLYQWVNDHQHQLTSYEELRQAIKMEFGLDIDATIDKVFSDTAQPAFEVLDVKKYEVLDDDRKRYQVLLDIKNSGDNDGVLEVKFDAKDQSNEEWWRRKVNEETEPETPGKLTVIQKGQIKRLGFVLDEKPNALTLNTIISRNIPSVISIPIGTMTSKKTSNSLFEGEMVIEEPAAINQYEVIVDNEDAGFSTFSPIKPTYMRAYLDSRNPTDKKYYGKWFRSYSKWLATTASDFYGKVIRSAHFTRSGDGEKLATWTPEFKDEGFYDIYVFMKGKNQNQSQRGDGDNRQFNYHYIINHGDGSDNIKFNLSNAGPGWNYLGSYYFNQSGGSVSLTDECDQRTVYADAIKWIKQ